MNILIYKLIDPITYEIRYIGKTKKSLKKRLYEHLTKRNLIPNTHKNNWIKKLLNMNLKPIIELIELADVNNWMEKEIFHIKNLKSQGFNLTNATDGGDGALGSKRTKEAIQKTRNTMFKKYGQYGVPVSEETKIKISQAQKGKKHSIERIENAAVKKRKILIQCSLSGETVKEWLGIRKTAEKFNVDYSTLRYAIKNQKELVGFIWKYQ